MLPPYFRQMIAELTDEDTHKNIATYRLNQIKGLTANFDLLPAYITF